MLNRRGCQSGNRAGPNQDPGDHVYMSGTIDRLLSVVEWFILSIACYVGFRKSFSPAFEGKLIPNQLSSHSFNFCHHSAVKGSKMPPSKFLAPIRVKAALPRLLWAQKPSCFHLSISWFPCPLVVKTRSNPGGSLSLVQYNVGSNARSVRWTGKGRHRFRSR